MNTLISNFQCLRCPNDFEKMSYVQIDVALSLLICQICDAVYPVIDNIPVLFNWGYRNSVFEIPYLKNAILLTNDPVVQNKIVRTVNKLGNITQYDEWHWEDEAFWSKEYDNYLNSRSQKKLERQDMAKRISCEGIS